MRVRKLVVLFGGVTLLMFSQAKAQEAAVAALPKAAELVEKNVKAMGGAAALKSIKTSKTSGQFEMAAFGLKADFTIEQAAPNKFRFQMTVPGAGEMLRVTDGKDAWEKSTGGVRTMEGVEKKQMILQSSLAAEQHVMENYDVTVVGIEDIDGVPCVKATFVPKSAAEGEKEQMTETRFYDTEKYLLRRTDITISMQGQSLPIQIIMSDYKKAGPTLAPHKITQKMTGVEQVMSINSYEFNKAIAEGSFVKPE